VFSIGGAVVIEHSHGGCLNPLLSEAVFSIRAGGRSWNAIPKGLNPLLSEAVFSINAKNPGHGPHLAVLILF